MRPLQMMIAFLALSAAMSGCLCTSTSQGMNTTSVASTSIAPTSIAPTSTPPPTASAKPDPTPIATAAPAPPPILAVNFDDNIYGVNRATGAVLWSQRLLGPDQPILANNTVYAVASAGLFGDDGHIYGWNAVTGQQTFVYQDRDDNFGPTVVGNLIYVGANQDGVYSLEDLGQGAFALLWHARPGSRLDSKSIPAAADNLVFIGEGDNRVYALSAKTGTTMWSFPTADYVDASPQVVNQVVYVGRVACPGGSCVYALDESGKELWHTMVDTAGSGGDRDLLVSNGVVYGTLANGAGTYALRARDGALLWQSPIGTADGDGFFLADASALYLESSATNVSAIEQSTHQLRWQLQRTNSTYQLLSVGNGVVYVGRSDSDTQAVYLQALRASDASVLWSAVLEAPQPTPTPTHA